MSTVEPSRLQQQEPHALSESEKAYVASLNPRERQLHELATQMLGSSYFVGKTHGFTKWLKAQQPK